MKQKLAPCNGTTSKSWSSPSPPTIAHYNGTYNGTPPKLAVTFPSTSTWHPAMAPCNGNTSTAPSNGTTSTPSKLVVIHVHSPKVGRRPTIAHYNGTLQWHPAMAPRPLPQSWSSPSPSTTVHYNGTLRWHPAMAPRPLHPAMAPWCHVQSAYSYRYLGKN